MRKKDAYYFSHDANSQDDPKCMLLIDQLGMEGYGIFWALIEKLRNEKDYKLPLNIINSLARRWGTSKEKVESVIKNYSLFIVEKDLFFSIRLQRSMEEKSEKARLSASYRWDNANALQSHTKRIANGMQNDAIKVKESKEKESISSEQVFEFLRQATFRIKVTDRQLKDEAAALIKKYDGEKIGSLRSICNDWAGRIKPIKKEVNV